MNESTQPSKKKKSKKEKGTRKNIRKIIDDEKLDERTKEARAAEEERIKRLLQREQRYCIKMRKSIRRLNSREFKGVAKDHRF